MSLQSEEENMIATLEKYRNTTVIPQDRAKVNTYRGFSNSGDTRLTTEHHDECLRIWNYVVLEHPEDRFL